MELPTLWTPDETWEDKKIVSRWNSLAAWIDDECADCHDLSVNRKVTSSHLLVSYSIAYVHPSSPQLQDISPSLHKFLSLAKSTSALSSICWIFGRRRAFDTRCCSVQHTRSIVTLRPTAPALIRSLRHSRSTLHVQSQLSFVANSCTFSGRCYPTLHLPERRRPKLEKSRKGGQDGASSKFVCELQSLRIPSFQQLRITILSYLLHERLARPILQRHHHERDTHRCSRSLSFIDTTSVDPRRSDQPICFQTN